MRLVTAYLGLRSMGVEDVGVICAVHHLTAGFLVFLTPAAIRTMCLGSMAICRHPVTCVSQNASLLTVTAERQNNSLCLNGHKPEGKLLLL